MSTIDGDSIIRMMGQPFGEDEMNQRFVDRHPDAPYLVSIVLFFFAGWHLVNFGNGQTVSLILLGTTAFYYGVMQQTLRRFNSVILVVGAWLVIGLMLIGAVALMIGVAG